MENQCHWDQVHAYLMNRRRYQIEYIFYNYTKNAQFSMHPRALFKMFMQLKAKSIEICFSKQYEAVGFFLL